MHEHTAQLETSPAALVSPSGDFSRRSRLGVVDSPVPPIRHVVAMLPGIVLSLVISLLDISEC